MSSFRVLAALTATGALTWLAASALHGQALGSLEVTIDEWAVPAKAHPHDPAAAPDGGLWYTGQRNNTIGRVDMASGQVKEYPLRTPNSGPHGITADAQGNIWFTGNTAAYIGELDPRTGAVVEYPMPDSAARDPHTLIFDRQGTLWFTVQGGNFVGKLDPPSGEVTLTPSLTPGSRPYGIVIMADGTPVFDLFGTNKIGTIDPKTLAITEYPLPEGARPRRIAVDGNDIVWYTDYQRGRLGRLDVKTKQVQEFPSPGGPKSQPYAISVTSDGAVWYSESGVAPNTLVRFDPARREFQKWNIPSGGGVVRHMVTAPNGDLLLACSGVDKVARVRIRPVSSAPVAGN